MIETKLKTTGHVGVYRVIEDHIYIKDVYMAKDEIIVCGIVGDPRVKGNIWKGWHKDSEIVNAFNRKEYFCNFSYNQKYLDWTKLERVN